MASGDIMNLGELTFGFSSVFYFLPVLLFLYYLAHSRLRSDRKKKADISPYLFRNDLESESPEYRLSTLPLIATTLFFAGIALSMPRYGFEQREERAGGVDIVLAVDLSRSMNTEDVSPNRMTIMRRKIQDLLALLDGDRISLLSFAGVSFIESPLTLDYGVIRLLLESLSSDLMPIQGSDLEAAVMGAVTSFKNIKGSVGRPRILLLLSDAEFDPETLESAFKIMREEKIIPFLIAIGTEQGAPVPGPGGFKRNSSGKVVFSRSELQPLVPHFQNLGGTAVRFSSNTSDLKEIYQKIRTARAINTDETYTVTKWYEYYQLPLLISLVILFIAWTSKGFVIPPGIHTRFTEALHKSSHSTTTSIFLISLFIHIPLTHAESPGDINSALNKYHQGQFEQALNELILLKESGHVSHRLNMALGNTFYRMNRFKEAVNEYTEAYQHSTNEKEQAEALYNQGNALTQLENYEHAISQYEKALEIQKHDKEISSNLSYVKKLLKMENEQSDSQSENDKDKQKSKKQDSESQDPNEQDQDKTKNQSSSQAPKKDMSDSPNKDDKNSQDKDNKNKEESKAEAPTPEPTTTNEPEESSNKDTSSATEESLPRHEILDHLLDALEENTSARAKFRHKKAMEELKELKKRPLGMDW